MCVISQEVADNLGDELQAQLLLIVAEWYMVEQDRPNDLPLVETVIEGAKTWVSRDLILIKQQDAHSSE